jgi:ribosomal protein L40E
MVKFPEADARWFRNVFVCRVCKSKTRAPILKVLAGRISCRKCGSKILRTKRKK